MLNCVPCPDGCSSCSNDTCFSCMDYYFMYTDVSTNISLCSYYSCPDNFRTDYSTNQCVACPEGCLNCLADNTCVSCAANYTLYWGECINYCPNGTYNYYNDYLSPASSSYYYYVPSFLSCSDCQDGCTSCSSYSSCNACEDGSYKLIKSNKTGVSDDLVQKLIGQGCA